MTMTHEDLNRSLGRVEGEMKAMTDRFDRFEQTLERIEQRLAKIEATENQRKGGAFVLLSLASGVGWLAGWLTSLFAK